MHVSDNYKLLRRLSHGAMSRVYLVKNNNTNTYFVFKVVNLSVFRYAPHYRELSILKSLDHDAIPRVIDSYFDNFNNRVCIMMPYIDGVNLDIFIERNGNITIKSAFRWFCQILEIIIYIHKEKIIHCDIKPANLMLDANQKIWLIDFGSACSLKEKALSAGEPNYAAPEIIAGAVVDYRSDIYAIGKSMIALIGEDIYYKMKGEVFQTTSHDKRLDFQIKFIKIINKCVQEDADLRYQSTTELLAALSEIAMINEV